MPKTAWEKIKSAFRTEKQSTRIKRVNDVVKQRKAAQLELEKAIRELAAARSGKRNGAT